MAANASAKNNPRVSKSLYHSFFDNALDGLVYCQMIFDKQGTPVDCRYIQVNQAFEKLTGLKGVVGKKATEVLPGIAASNPELFKICGRVSTSGVSERFEIYVEPLARWLYVSIYSPKRKFFVATFQNITDRKQIEKDLENAKIAARNVLEDLQVEKETLAHEKAKAEATLASIGDGVIIVDSDGKITFLNQSAQNLLGWKNEEVLGKLIFDTVSLEDEKGARVSTNARPMALALSLAIATTTTTADPTYYYVRKNKTKLPAAIMVTPIMLEGKVIGAIEVFRDITKEREVDRAKTEFVSLASHQLRTPLSSVRWYSDMLLDGDAGTINEKQKQYLEKIEQSNLRMIELVNTLLHVSRLELGMTQVRVGSVQLQSIITEVLQDMESFWRKKEVSVKVKIPKKLLPVMTDVKLVRIVIENLISNAIKYTAPHGTVKIVAQEVPAGEHFNTRTASRKSIGMSVSDSGIGIPKGSQGKIFDKLFRAENAQKMDSDGVGLGLYLTRLVLERLKGEAWFTSRTGEGTSFFVLLPYAGLQQKRESRIVANLV